MKTGIQKVLAMKSLNLRRPSGNEFGSPFIPGTRSDRLCPTGPRIAEDPGNGFTLTEVLVVAAIIAVLIVLLIPSLTAFRDRALAAKCAGNLRSMGGAIRLSASDDNGKWVILDSLYGTWSKRLRDRGYLLADGASFCPCFNPKHYAPYQTYGATWLGLALAPDDQNIITCLPSQGTRTYYDINLMVIAKPSKYLLLADSYTTRFKSQYHIVQGGTSLDEIHLRHNNRANVLFADGHVDALDTNGLHDIGWNRAFDKNGTLTNF